MILSLSIAIPFFTILIVNYLRAEYCKKPPNSNEEMNPPESVVVAGVVVADNSDADADVGTKTAA